MEMFALQYVQQGEIMQKSSLLFSFLLSSEITVNSWLYETILNHFNSTPQQKLLP